jgi:hypothetical protein
MSHVGGSLAGGRRVPYFIDGSALRAWRYGIESS